MTREEAWILLNHVFYLSAGKAWKLLAEFDQDPSLFLATDISIFAEKAGETIALRYRNLDQKKFLDSVTANCQKADLRVITQDSQEYPSILKEIFDPPLVLFAKGKTLSEDFWGAAVIGTRYPSEYGKSLAYDFAKALSRHNIPVVSGLARGLDTQAHQGALTEKGGTVAILGSGLDCIYPPENLDLSREIAQQGTLLSEYEPGTQPLSQHFPFRNRIISGLSRGVLVVEAQKKSGTLITASSALDQNRLVWAIPGRPRDKLSEGCNRVIQMGAKLVVEPSDVITDLGYETEVSPEQCLLFAADLKGHDKTVYDLFSEDPQHIDELCMKSGLSPQQISLALLNLEMQRLLKRLPGNHFIKV